VLAPVLDAANVLRQSLQCNKFLQNRGTRTADFPLWL
jgi:hypothetical protein